MIYLDTHIVVWLFSGLTEKISNASLALIERSEIRISPMVRLELAFLQEIGRINYSADDIIDELGQTIDLIECPKSFIAVAKKATSISWTKDPFDRIIVAQAMLSESPLLTRDTRIVENYSLAIS